MAVAIVGGGLFLSSRRRFEMFEHLFLETGFPVHACLLFVIVWILTQELKDDEKQSKNH